MRPQARRPATVAALVAVALASAGTAAVADARPAASHRAWQATPAAHAAGPRPAPTPPLRFGIYPGGGVGMVLARGAAVAEDAGRRLDALRRLRGDREFVLHLYSDWTGTRPAADEVAAALGEVDAYTAAGFTVETVVRYRPARAQDRGNPRRYAAHVARTVAALARNPRVLGVQVTNEVNVTGAPAAADGAYPGARRALVRGVIAADRAVRAGRRPGLLVGFNWAAGRNAGPDAAFWRALRREGGPAFARAVDYVGADIYPGTWSAPKAVDAAGVGRAMTATIRHLRTVALPQAGLGRSVALHIAENGFPTGAARSEAAQARLIRAALLAVDRARAPYGVTDHRFFDLRDARSGQADLEHGYGVLRDDYSEKPGFAVLASLVRRLGRQPTPPTRRSGRR